MCEPAVLSFCLAASHRQAHLRGLCQHSSDSALSTILPRLLRIVLQLLTRCCVLLRRGDRVTYRRRKSFRTVSNKVRKVKTPGGKLVLHYTGKKGKAPTCGDAGCNQRLHGVRPPLCPPLPLALARPWWPCMTGEWTVPSRL